jgi:DNA-binding transcriptional LysR family regulator
MLIDLIQLRTFIVVAEARHLTRAAERLHISQSTASAHIRAVEDTLDIQLFLRSNRNMELTQAGQMLLRQAKLLLNNAVEFTAFAREIRGKVEGSLMIGMSGEPSTSNVGAIVAHLRSIHPLITADLRALASLAIQQALKTGELDLGIMLCEPNDPSFLYHQLCSVPFRIAGPIAWKCQIESASWAELARLPWITPNDVSHSASTLLSRLFYERGLELNTVARADRASLGRQLAMSGVGMLLMREEQAVECEKEELLALSSLNVPCLPLVIAHATSREDCPLIRAFLDAAKATWPEMELLRSE